MTITIRGPDGAIIDFPDGTPEEEMNAAMAKAYPLPAETAPQDDPGFLANTIRALTTGANPFQDRMVAAEKTILPEALGGSPGFGGYAENLEQERARNEQLREQHPTLANLGQGSGAALSSIAVPAAALGRYAQGAGVLGRTALGSAAGGGVGAVQGLGVAPDLTDSAQALESGLRGGLGGEALGAAFPAAGAAIGRAMSPLATALRGWRGQAPEVAALGKDVSAAYESVKNLGAAYKPEAIQRLTDKIAADAAEAEIDSGLNPTASAVIANLQKRSSDAMESGTPITLDQLDKARQFVNDNLSGLPEPKQSRFGQIIKSNIDDFIFGAKPEDMAVPVPSNALGARVSKAVTPVDLPFTMRPKPEGPAPLSFKVTPKGYKGQGASIDIADERGSPIATMLIRNEGDNIAITNMESLHEGFQPGSLGTIAIRNIARKLGETYPDAKTISGFHVTGAGAGEGRESRITIPRGGAPGKPGEVSQPEALPVNLSPLRAAIGYEPAVRIGGKLFRGGSHADAIERASKRLGVPVEELISKAGGEQGVFDNLDGFINSEGRFLSRADAYAAVEAAGPAARATTPYDSLPSGSLEMASGGASEAADAIANARGLAQRQFKAKALAEALGKAEDRASVSGTGGNIENTTRQKLLAIRDNEPWSQDEKTQLNSMIRGNPFSNTVRQLTRFGPKGNALVSLGELGMLMSGHPGAMAIGAGGMAAQGVEALMRRNAQQKLLATILAGGKAPATNAALPTASTRAMLAATLAGIKIY